MREFLGLAAIAALLVSGVQVLRRHQDRGFLSPADQQALRDAPNEAADTQAGKCSSAAIERLMAREEARQSSLKECAHTPARLAADGGLDGVCAASWKALDEAEAQAAPCMTDAQLARFARWRDRYDIYCGMILDFKLKKNHPYENQCRVDWAWLNPYDQKQSQAAERRFRESLETVSGVLKHERARAESLRECAGYSKAAIDFGAPDGVCSVDWSYLSPAEARLGPRMSREELQQFLDLRASYDESCQGLSKTLGREARAVSMCGADWTWLSSACSSMQLKAGGERALGLLKQSP